MGPARSAEDSQAGQGPLLLALLGGLWRRGGWVDRFGT